MTQKPGRGDPPDDTKLSPESVVGKVLFGQATSWVRRFIGLFYAAVAGVMLAISWVPLAPLFSTWHASIVASASADAEVIGHRYVCERSWAAQLAESGRDHVVRGEAGCWMRAEALLRFVDAGGASHEVVALDPYDMLIFQGLTPGTTPNPFQRLVPLVRPEFLAEAEAIPKLQSVESQGPPSYDYDAMAAGKQPLWNQYEALALRSDDPLLFEALAWLGPTPGTRVQLRYDPGDPEHAWLAGLFGQPSSLRIPIQVGLILVPLGTWILWHVIGLYPTGPRREIPIALTVLAVLATPYWAPRLFDVVEWFSEDGRAAAALREDFSEIGGRHDLRTAPVAGDELVRVANGTDSGAIQRELLAGLMPPRPARSFATLGEAYGALCEAAGVRFAALERAERETRYQRLGELVRQGVDGPAVCFMPAALGEARAQLQAGQPLGTSLGNLMVSFTQGDPIGSSFAGDYERDHKWRVQATAVLMEKSRRAAEAPDEEEPSGAGGT